MSHLFALAQGIPFNQLHDEAMPVDIDGAWNGKPVLIEDLHVSELLQGSKPTKVEPRSILSVLQVVAVQLDGSERNATQSMELDHDDSRRNRKDSGAPRSELRKQVVQINGRLLGLGFG